MIARLSGNGEIEDIGIGIDSYMVVEANHIERLQLEDDIMASTLSIL